LKTKFLAMVVAAAGLAAGCGKDEVADHNKNLKPVTAKPGDLKMAGSDGPAGQGAAAPKPTAPP